MGKQAKKVKTKAKINWGWDAPEDRNGKATRSTRAKSRKIKKLGFKAILIILMVTIIGAAIGVGTCWFLTRDDCFTITGKEEITLSIKVGGEEWTEENSYIDQGVKIVSFGRDISNKVYVETDLKKTDDGRYYADEIGTYYMIYKVDDIKYGKIFTVERIRLITFVEGMPENDVEGGNYEE